VHWQVLQLPVLQWLGLQWQMPQLLVLQWQVPQLLVLQWLVLLLLLVLLRQRQSLQRSIKWGHRRRGACHLLAVSMHRLVCSATSFALYPPQNAFDTSCDSSRWTLAKSVCKGA
jgi:hypothetical protein